MYFIWQNQFRLHIIKSIKKENRHFWIQTEDNTGKTVKIQTSHMFTNTS